MSHNARQRHLKPTIKERWRDRQISLGPPRFDRRNFIVQPVSAFDADFNINLSQINMEGTRSVHSHNTKSLPPKNSAT